MPPRFYPTPLISEVPDVDVAGALVPVQVDMERDHGVYVEPNVWMRHRW